MELLKVDALLGQVGDVDRFEVVGDRHSTGRGVGNGALVPVGRQDEFLEVVHRVPEIIGVGVLEVNGEAARLRVSGAGTDAGAALRVGAFGVGVLVTDDRKLNALLLDVNVTVSQEVILAGAV